MWEKTEEARKRVIARDQADRDGHGKPKLVDWTHEGEKRGATTGHSVIFAYADGAMRRFDGVKWHKVA